MNKSLLISALFVGASLAASAQAYDGKVNFKGTILDSACVVDADSQDLDVNLGKVAKTVFTNVGDTSTAMPFSLKLTGCPAAVTQAAIRFEGATVSGKPDVLELDGTSMAVGVGVQVKDKAGQKITFGQESSTYALVPGDNVLDFTAYYVSTLVNTSITSGAANSVANFTVVYP